MGKEGDDDGYMYREFGVAGRYPPISLLGPATSLEPNSPPLLFAGVEVEPFMYGEPLGTWCVLYPNPGTVEEGPRWLLLRTSRSPV